MSLQQLVVSYRDTDIYSDDLDLFVGAKWLNASCLGYCMKRMEMEMDSEMEPFKFEYGVCYTGASSGSSAGVDTGTTTTTIGLVDPLVVSFMRLQCDTEEEFAELEEGLQLRRKQWVLLAINDCQSFQESSSHWSVLLVNVPTGQSFHFDSHGSYNKPAAIAMIDPLSKLLHRELPDPINIACPQQTNGWDCGVYALVFMRKVLPLLQPGGRFSSASCITEDILQALQVAVNDITPKMVTAYRAEMHLDIQRVAALSASSKSSKS